MPLDAARDAVIVMQGRVIETLATGKQPGSHLPWSEYPDDKVPHFPAGACECGAGLAGAADLGVAASHQSAAVSGRGGRGCQGQDSQRVLRASG